MMLMESCLPSAPTIVPSGTPRAPERIRAGCLKPIWLPAERVCLRLTRRISLTRAESSYILRNTHSTLCSSIASITNGNRWSARLRRTSPR